MAVTSLHYTRIVSILLNFISFFPQYSLYQDLHFFFNFAFQKTRIISAHGDTISSPQNVPEPKKRAFLSTAKEKNLHVVIEGILPILA